MLSRFNFIPNKLLCLLLLGFVVGGCSGAATPFKAYEGEKEIKNLALIKGMSGKAGGLFWNLDVMVVDNTVVPVLARYPSEVLVELGRHYFQVRFSRGQIDSYGELWLDAEQGKTYILKSMEEGSGVYFWIENEKTGERVGGVPGGEPENQKATDESK